MEAESVDDRTQETIDKVQEAMRRKQEEEIRKWNAEREALGDALEDNLEAIESIQDGDEGWLRHETREWGAVLFYSLMVALYLWLVVMSARRVGMDMYRRGYAKGLPAGWYERGHYEAGKEN